MVEFVEDSFRDLIIKIKSFYFWFEFVCSYVILSILIFFVGIYRGNMERFIMERINENLKRNFWEFFCGELVVNKVDELFFFFVENFLG